jgi:hypothetical protein
MKQANNVNVVKKDFKHWKKKFETTNANYNKDEDIAIKGESM